MDKKITAICIAAVVVIVAVGAIFAVTNLTKNNQSENGNQNDNYSMDSYDGYIMNLEGAASIALCSSDIEGNTKSKPSLDAKIVFGEQSTDNTSNKLYKIDKKGNFSEITMKNTGDAVIKIDRGINYLTVDGDYAIFEVNATYLGYKASIVDEYYEKNGYYLDPTKKLTYLVELSSGRIFLLSQLSFHFYESISPITGELDSHFSYTEGYITYAGHSDRYLYFLINFCLWRLSVDNDEILAEEVLSSALGSPENISIARNDVINFKASLGSGNINYYLYPSGVVEKNVTYELLGGYFVSSVTYRDDIFPVSCERVIDKNNTTTYNFSNDESYGLAKEKLDQYALYSTTNGDVYIAFVYEYRYTFPDKNIYGCFKYTLDKSDYSVTCEKLDESFFNPVKNGLSIYGSNYHSLLKSSVMYMQKVNPDDDCLYKTDLYVLGSYGYILSSNSDDSDDSDDSDLVLSMYNFETQTSSTKTINSILQFTSISVKDNYIQIDGISNKLDRCTVYIDVDGNVTSEIKQYEYKIVTIYALDINSEE